MNKALLLGTTGMAVAFAMLAFGFVRRQPADANADAAQPQVRSPRRTRRSTAPRSRGIIRDYLLRTRKCCSRCRQALEAKQKEEQRIAHLDVIKNAKDQIFNAAYDGVVGNPNGKITIVEFYDYNCGFCKRAIRTCRR